MSGTGIYKMFTMGWFAIKSSTASAVARGQSRMSRTRNS